MPLEIERCHDEDLVIVHGNDTIVITVTSPYPVKLSIDGPRTFKVHRGEFLRRMRGAAPPAKGG